MDQENIITSLRTSLQHAQAIIDQLATKNPALLNEIVSALPVPPPLSSRSLSVPETKSSGEEDDPPPPDPNTNNDDETNSVSSASTFTPAPISEAQAGTMFAESRNMERDAFFKARIAAGIDDNKIIDLTPKIDCKKEVERASKNGPIGLVNVMKLYPEEEAVQRRSLRLLIPLSKNPSTRTLLGSYGLIPLISTLLKLHHKTSEGCTHFSIRVLSNLAFSDNDNKAKIGQLVLDDILLGMKNYPDNLELQCDGMSVLCNLGHESDTNKRLIAQRGGVSSVLDAMEGHLGSLKIQRQACWALLTVAGDEVAAKRVASDGGVGAVLAAMVNFEGEGDLQGFGIWALCNVAFGSEALARFVAQNGAPEVAQRAIYKHPGVKEVMSKAEELMKRIGKYVKPTNTIGKPIQQS
ncbi:hypothetical protein TrLO_g14803 [Triparma laevis f. longispina]|uniref:Uncharacterized protein n=1 Tax=Triparma laevis f. longispina TaxID=1714387 RepID=A0A9W7L094_9STRA|nr:hypothetical protein TrLO_g14803 [Triparma laevis f. longispina]